ncbi:Ger(x)C family spore germination protein [Gorillibacterium sp. CAU 1737]|uniref:Ger(x)C family spore germination protein n=1 Tax=Gorillibacterium sp. CAU 1737 TaxID=3140362 RepID=UPI003260AE37
MGKGSRPGQMILLILVLIFTSLFAAGCWDRRELNAISLVLALGIDQEKDQCKVSAQVVIPSSVKSKQSNNGNTVVVYTSTAPTLFEAIQKLSQTSPREIYISQLRMLILGEEYARNGITESVEMLTRHPSVRSDFFIAIAKEHRAEELLRVPSRLESVPANSLYSNLLTTTDNWAVSAKVTVDKLAQQLATEGVEPVLPALELQQKDSRSPPLIKLTGLGVIKGDRLVGWLNEQESRGYNYIMNLVQSSTGHVTFENNGLISLRVLRTTTKKKVSLSKKTPVVHVRVKMIDTITEILRVPLDLSKPEEIAKLEKKCNERTIFVMRKAQDAAQRRFQADIFGFGKLIHETNPKAWKSMAQNWPALFPDVEVVYQVDNQVRRIGNTSESFIGK